jgi:hypothetical protein
MYRYYVNLTFRDSDCNSYVRSYSGFSSVAGTFTDFVNASKARAANSIDASKKRITHIYGTCEIFGGNTTQEVIIDKKY